MLIIQDLEYFKMKNERIGKINPIKTLTSLMGDAKLYPFGGISIIDEDTGDEEWYWWRSCDRFHSPDAMFMRLLDLSLTHTISEIGVDQFVLNDVIHRIKITFKRLESNEACGNVSSEFMDILYGIVKGPWVLP